MDRKIGCLFVGLVFRCGHKPVGGNSGNGQILGMMDLVNFLEMYLRRKFKYRKNYWIEDFRFVSQKERRFFLDYIQRQIFPTRFFGELKMGFRKNYGRESFSLFPRNFEEDCSTFG